MPDDRYAGTLAQLNIGMRPAASHPPAPAGLLVPGNIQLATRPVVTNRDGSISSVRSMGMTDENPSSPHYGKEVLVPTVIPDARGNWMVDFSGDLAKRRYYQTGEHLGVFDTSDHSDAYAQRLHEDYMNGVYGPQYVPKGYTPR